MATDTFTCDVCHGTFTKAWSDAEAAAEHTEVFGTPPEPDDPTLCDDCYRDFRIWFAARTFDVPPHMLHPGGSTP